MPLRNVDQRSGGGERRSGSREVCTVGAGPGRAPVSRVRGWSRPAPGLGSAPERREWFADVPLGHGSSDPNAAHGAPEPQDLFWVEGKGGCSEAAFLEGALSPEPSRTEGGRVCDSCLPVGGYLGRRRTPHKPGSCTHATLLGDWNSVLFSTGRSRSTERLSDLPRSHSR